MATHSSTLAWKIPWTEEPGGLQSLGSRRARHDWATSLSLFTFMHWRQKWQPTPVFLPGESQDGRVWWAAVYGVSQSRTRLKWLSSSNIPLSFQNNHTSERASWLSQINAGYHLQYRRLWFYPWIGKIPWRRKWQPAPVFLPGKIPCQRSLVGYKIHGVTRVGHDLVTKPPLPSLREFD